MDSIPFNFNEIKIILGLIFIPISILLLSFSVLWQIFVMLTETYSLNKYKDIKLFIVISILLFSFSLAVYYFCPNARKKGIVFFITSFLGGAMYYLFRTWLPFK